MLFSVLLVVCSILSPSTADALHHRRVRQASYDENTCTTPDSKSGSCVALTKCRFLYNLLQIDGRNPTTADFLRKSRCHNLSENGIPVVCCPSESSSPRPSGVTRPPVQRPNTTPSLNYGECGKSKRSDTRIVGGKNSSLGDWPWMAGLGFTTGSRPNIDFKCGGTLISSKWVVTAAHCTTDLRNMKLTVARLGDLDLDPNTDDKASPVDAQIDQIIPHPEYTSNPITNDIALLRLKNSVQFTPLIQPICLLTGADARSDSYYNRKRPFIIGWGAVEWRGVSSSRLQEATLAMINHTHCGEIYKGQRGAKIDHRVLCAGEKGKDTCQGDSGGPLIFPVKGSDDGKNNTYFLGGIVSFGIRCADPDFPGVYTRIAAFSDWISQTTGLPLD